MKKTAYTLLLVTAWSLPMGATTLKAGDMNKDGKLSISDVALLVKKLPMKASLTAEELALADVDGNGTFEVADILYLSDVLVGKRESRNVNLPDQIPVDEKTDKPFD